MPFLILLAGLAAAGLVAAQEDAEEDDIEDAEKVEQAQPAKRLRGVLRNRGFKFDPANLEQWVFGPVRPGAPRKSMESNLLVRIEEAHRICELDGKQREKLTLAGEVDIEHLFERIDAFREKWTGMVDEPVLQDEFTTEFNTLRAAATGSPFREGSFFDKVARQTLTPDQRPAYLAWNEEFYDHRGRMLRENLIRFLERRVEVDADRRNALAALLKKRLRNVREGPDELLIYVLSASRIPEEEYRTVLQDAQWEQLKMMFNLAEPRRQALEASGAVLDPIPDEDQASEGVSG
jgi:hypothetical protein